jgi:hypothetical protein
MLTIAFGIVLGVAMLAAIALALGWVMEAFDLL